MAFNPLEEGGITGGAGAQQARQALLAQLGTLPLDEKNKPVGDDLPDPNAGQYGTPQKVDYTQMGQYGVGGGYNSDKFKNPWDQRSEKYQIGTVLSHFDPNAGITEDVLKALNEANIHGAKFSGSGDKLTIDNAGNYDRFGTGGTSDIIEGFKDKNRQHGWGAWFVDPNEGAAGPVGKASPAGGIGPDLTSYFTGGVGHLMDSNFLKTLMDQARQTAGPASTDRNALLSLLQGA